MKALHNLRLLERFKELETVNAGDQETVINLIDAVIVKSKVEGAVKPNAILAGCGFNIRKLLRAILLWLFKERCRASLPSF
jgi:hypothetical protein